MSRSSILECGGLPAPLQRKPGHDQTKRGKTTVSDKPRLRKVGSEPAATSKLTLQNGAATQRPSKPRYISLAPTHI